MLGLGRQLIDGRHDGIGLSLQFGSAALLNFSGAVDQPGEEGVQFLAHLGCGAKKGISCPFIAHPVPDRLVGVEVRNVGRPGHQTQVQIGCLLLVLLPYIKKNH